MLRVWWDILKAANRHQVTLLGFLDLSAAFDCVDHDIFYCIDFRSVLLYTAELEQLILRHSLHIHQYVDDSQVYISMPISDVRVAVHSFTV